jgi:nucleoid-associated protein YgaU
MGTFEKLGILVIVVIIVMILAVAIYQWGGAGTTPTTTVVGTSGPVLTVKDLDELMAEQAEAVKPAPPTGGDPATWPGGVPKRYRIQRDDKVWVLVVKRWGLKEGFIQAIEQANPKIDFKRLKPGTEISIPDPANYTRTTADKQAAPQKPSGSRLYEVKGGDTLESIAFLHLGAKTRWHDIVGMNPGLEPKRLFEGQEIYLPLK